MQSYTGAIEMSKLEVRPLNSLQLLGEIRHKKYRGEMEECKEGWGIKNNKKSHRTEKTLSIVMQEADYYPMITFIRDINI